jgi:hypothetical protein
MLQQPVTGWCQLYIVTLSDKEFCPEDLLQLLDACADSRLCQEKCISGTAEMARSCDFEKGLEKRDIQWTAFPLAVVSRASHLERKRRMERTQSGTGTGIQVNETHWIIDEEF